MDKTVREKVLFHGNVLITEVPGAFPSRQAPHRVADHFWAQRWPRILAPQASGHVRAPVRFLPYPRRGSAEVASERQSWGSSRPASPLSVRRAPVWRGASQPPRKWRQVLSGLGGGGGGECVSRTADLKTFLSIILMAEQRSGTEDLSLRHLPKVPPTPSTLHLSPLFGNRNCRFVGAPRNFSAIRSLCARGAGT